MRTIEVKSPTRVDLAGGTIDLWPLHCILGGATTVNVAIDVWTKAKLIETESSDIEINSLDLKKNFKFNNLNDLLRSSDPDLKLYQTVLGYLPQKTGFYLETSSESPVGGGLGGSSSLMISIMKALGREKKETHQLVHEAHNLEAALLNTPTGTQDYYPAASGGLNILKYSTSGINQEVIEIQNTPLHSNFVLVYTGKSHHSGLNNFEVMKAVVSKDVKTIKALKDIALIANETEKVCRKQDWDKIPALFRAEYEARVRLSPAFTCPEIEKLNKVALSAGAEAMKICGAGGGGCVLLWVTPNHKLDVTAACTREGFTVMAAKPVNPLRG